MLVLSREQNEKIVFPNLGITVQILQIARKRVRIGIDAPRNICVLRHEIDPGALADRGATESQAHWDKRIHDIRNRAHRATLAIHVAQKQLAKGQIDEPSLTLSGALRELEALDQEFGTVWKKGSAAPARDRAVRRALLVEDDANECELLAAYLRMSGFEVDTAGDGLEAMRYLSSHQRPDIVLLDMKMPRLDGAKTVSSIRGNPEYKGLKVFAVSGSNRQELGVAVGPRGVDRWFTKPLNPTELVDVLDRELNAECVSA